MKKKVYIQPEQCFIAIVNRGYICGENSLPYGGSEGSGVAETKERNDDTDAPTGWGNLW